MGSNIIRVVASGERSPYRPSVSRETRRLLMTAVLAVLTLWILARIRFPERPIDPNPVPPLLGQLAGTSGFSDLSTAVQTLRDRLGPSLVALVPSGTGVEPAPYPAERAPALRIRDGFAVAILPPRPRVGAQDPLGLVAEDLASGLAVIRVGNEMPAAVPSPWEPQRLDQPRYVMASVASIGGVSLRPAFVGSLTPVEIPGWTGPAWALPGDADVLPGMFLFSEDAQLLGAVIRHEEGLAVVPGNTLLAAADDLLLHPQTIAVGLGIEVQPLTRQLSLASGADTGVVVTWVDPASPAATSMTAGDVIRAVDGVSIRTPEQWRVRMAHLGAGSTIALGVVRRGARLDLQITAAAASDAVPATSPGLLMRSIARVGADVVGVARGSPADAAGIEAGDVITAIGDIPAPTAAQVGSAFAAAPRGELLVIALVRGSTHRVVALRR